MSVRITTTRQVTDTTTAPAGGPSVQGTQYKAFVSIVDKITERVFQGRGAPGATGPAGPQGPPGPAGSPGTAKALRLTGNITLAISAAGNDGNPSRPAASTSGDLSAFPFATLAGALAYLPDNGGGYTATINDSRTSPEALTGGGFQNGSLVINGTPFGVVTLQDIGNLTIGGGASLAGDLNLRSCIATVTATLAGAGRLVARRCDLTCDLTASSCTAGVLRAYHCSYVAYGVASSGCSANVVELHNVPFSELRGVGLTGSNPSAPFAVFATKGGRHLFTGATMTTATANALDLEGNPLSWSQLQASNYESGGTYAYWSDEIWTKLAKLLIQNNSSQDFDDLVTRDLQFNRFFKQYGADRALPTTNLVANDLSQGAYTEVAAHDLGGQANATVIGLQLTKVKTANNNHASIRFPSTSDAPGTGFGTHGRIKNRTPYIIDLYAPTDGSHIINGNNALAPGTPLQIPPGACVNWFTEADPSNALGAVGNWNVDQ